MHPTKAFNNLNHRGIYMRILKLEKSFSENFKALSNELNKLFEKIINYGKVDLNNNEISKAILIRLKYYYDHQNAIKELLNKRYASPAADFFVETIAFYLNVVFKIYKMPLEVYSERQIKRKRGSIRPDISIWRGDTEVVAIIECKTQLGWNRHDWKNNFSERENKLKKEFPNASAFLIVLTSLNWPGFGEDENVGKKYFCLSNVWPTDINIDKLEGDLLNPIEPIICNLIKKYKS